MRYISSLAVDVSGCPRQGAVYAVQMDKNSRYLLISLMDGNTLFEPPEGATARIAWQKPSGLQVFDDAEITDGKIQVSLTEQMLTEPGICFAEIKLYQGESLLTSATFEIDVRPEVLDNDQVESSYEYDALTNALQKVDGLQDEIEQAVQEANDAADRAEEAAGSAGGFLVGDGLIMEGGVLSVDTAKEVEEDNTKPVTSGAVYTQLGNVEALLASI